MPHYLRSNHDGRMNGPCTYRVVSVAGTITGQASHNGYVWTAILHTGKRLSATYFKGLKRKLEKTS